MHGKSRAVCFNEDLFDRGVWDNTGHKYRCTGAITDTTFPACKQQTGKQGSVITQNVLQMVGVIEALSDPGGTDGYKIARIHSDQGSEFKLLSEPCDGRGIAVTTG